MSKSNPMRGLYILSDIVKAINLFPHKQINVEKLLYYYTLKHIAHEDPFSAAITLKYIANNIA